MRWPVLAVLGAGCSAAARPRHRAPPPVSGQDRSFRYVALGDSWAAGPLMTLPVGEPVFCGRSATNYPAQLAALLDVDEFVDVTCGSASTEDVTGPRRSTRSTWGSTWARHHPRRMR